MNSTIMKRNCFFNEVLNSSLTYKLLYEILIFFPYFKIILIPTSRSTTNTLLTVPVYNNITTENETKNTQT